MGRVYICGGGGGGITSDDVTAPASKVLTGYNTITTDSNDEVIVGTMPYGSTSVSGATVTTGSGYFESAITNTVQSGQVVVPSSTVPLTTETGGGITISGLNVAISKVVDIQPNVSEGYVTDGTTGQVTITGNVTVPVDTYDGTVE